MKQVKKRTIGIVIGVAALIIIATTVVISKTNNSNNNSATGNVTASGSVSLGPVTNPSFSKNSFGLTIGEHLWPKSVPDAAWEKQIKDLAATDTHWARFAFPWGKIEPNAPSADGKHTYDFSVANYVADFYNKLNINLDVELNQAVSWSHADSFYGCDAASGNTIDPATDKPDFRLEDYAAYAHALADDLYGYSNVKAMELGNEPDHRSPPPAAAPNACEYTAQDTMGYAQIKSAETARGNATRYVILNAGIAGGADKGKSILSTTFLDRMYMHNHNSSAGLFDAFSMHGISWPDSPQEDLLGLSADHTTCSKQAGMPSDPKGWCHLWTTRQVMLKYHDDAKQVWITAFGIPSFPENRYGSGSTPNSWKDGSTISDTRWKSILSKYQPPALDTNGNPVPPSPADCYPGCSPVKDFLNKGTANTQSTGIAQAYSLIATSQYNWVGPLFYFDFIDKSSPGKSSNGDASDDSYNGDFAGLVDFNGNHKPAYNAYKSLVDAAPNGN